MKKIAILGVTGYIGKSLLQEFLLEESKNYKLFLFSRSHNTASALIKQIPKKTKYTTHSYNEFSQYTYDVIINCTGISSLAGLQKKEFEVFKVTEEIDSLVIEYLLEHKKTLYINLSSGAVYGDNFGKPVNEMTKTILLPGFCGTSSAYAIAKINAEAKHRSMHALNIVDLRVFAFFSRFVDVNTMFLMSDIVRCMKSKKVFETKGNDIVRDYITSSDLFSLIKLLMQQEKINDYFDVYSKKEVSKFELLDFLKKKYDFKYHVTEGGVSELSPTKNIYYSTNKKAEEIGYYPELTSLTGIEKELDLLFPHSK